MTMLNMLLEIKMDPKKSMEFGDPTEPLGPSSGIRIRYMDTAGGSQYRLCTLDGTGRESSGGIYELDEESALIQATKMEERYLRPLPARLSQALHRPWSIRDQTRLQWFVTTEPVEPARPYSEKARPGEVTVVLGGKPEGSSRYIELEAEAGSVYVTVQDTHHDVTRIVVRGVEYAHALAGTLNDMGYKASHVPAACGVYFQRDVDELDRANSILDEVVRVKGGLSIIDLKS